MSAHRARRWGAGLLGVVLASGLLGGGTASAVTGATPVPDGTYAFTAKVTFGDARACTGALVDQNFVVTAKTCLTDGTTPVAAGAPTKPTTVVVGRTDLTTTAGRELAAVAVVPHPDRNLALLRLSAPVAGIAPVALAATAPAAAETLKVAGYGRTATEWVPDRLHAADFTVQAVAADTADIVGASAGATICKGDAGGPALRDVAGTPQLVAISNTSWQKGCLAETETRDGATVTRVDDLGSWIREQTADVQIFGVAAGGQLTYSVIDAASGQLRANRQSTATLGFTAKAMATLNENTILITSTSGTMYRVDVTGLDPLTFTTTSVMDGWSTYDRLAYDGYGSLYGIIATTNELRRRTLTTEKPATAADLSRSTVVATGFSQKTLTASGPGRILGNIADGRLLSYKINGGGPEGFVYSALAATGWAGYTHVLSPGGGWYFARTSTGGLDRYRDANPYDGSGADLTKSTAVSTSGWSQTLLSARPWHGLVSVYGAKPDGRLSYTAFDPVTGATVFSTVSTQTLGFTPKTLATLNSDTLLVTDGGDLYRVDITGTQPLTFTRTASIQGGWTHTRLVYDGYGSLFGQAGSVLHRYTVTKSKPAVATDITNHVVPISSGFGVLSLGANGKGHLITTTSTGALATYYITPAGAWDGRFDPATTGWSGVTSLFSPGSGHYYRRDANGVLTGYLETSPFDSTGADLTAYVPTGTAGGGWDAILSVQPYDAWPDSTRRW
ncbi:trypsin-like serine protease [Micromonospora chersina]|uniref:Tachylectin n=1 Tax=Micromonospora chersina TaxID=47854 RepID=A0A1C6V131_9ACTN|nr:trypsin-like serine protease [Micromonospora chersina]SCL60008.1 Tachylectin [Micromonospora chersina]